MSEYEILYQEALDYLYSFVDYSLTRNFRYTPEKFNLERIFKFLELLGNPQEKYAIYHVAGTKGKGSTSALIASALQAEGYRVGFYTSPHLQDYTERIQVDGEQISHKDFVELVGEIKSYVDQVPQLTTFEITTAMAFLYFARQECQVAVIEVGLGGRLDATNVVTPTVSVITSLSMDHMNVLGDTLAKIAFEKAGIIKPGKPVVTSPQLPEAMAVLEEVARERGSELFKVGQDFHFAPWSHDLEGQTLFVWKDDEQESVNSFIESGGHTDWEPLRLRIPLLGYHQVQNAATAYGALQIGKQRGVYISDSSIQKGFSNVKWPARFEILNKNPMLIVDSAHNRDSALKLRLTLDDYLPGKPVILIFGVSEDKDISGMLEELLPRVKRVIATQSVHPRAMDATALVKLIRQHGMRADAIVPVEKALLTALEIAETSEAVVLAAGSLFIAAAVRYAWQQYVQPQLQTSHP
ncbi:MAG: folylpolyglutamate synthase/dihydrofolate synthase family protein [Anaerolinea sp.]